MASIQEVEKGIFQIIPTHIHADHGGGAGYLAQTAKQATVVAHPKGAPHYQDPSMLIAGTRKIFWHLITEIGK